MPLVVDFGWVTGERRSLNRVHAVLTVGKRKDPLPTLSTTARPLLRNANEQQYPRPGRTSRGVSKR
eukprot:5420809-Amphidinium_carterae.2